MSTATSRVTTFLDNQLRTGHDSAADPRDLVDGRHPDSRHPDSRRSRGRRDLAIDRLRGLCLLSMTVGHLAYAGSAPSALDKLVHILLWVSGAAGFVFLSGVSIGLFSRARGGPGPELDRWVAGRAVFLTVIAVALNLGGLAWFELVGRPAWFPASDPDPVSIATGRWWLAGTDVLVMYAAFLTVVAVVGRWPARAPRATLAVSAAVYAAAVALPDIGPTESPGASPIWDLPAWQLLFFTGLVAGWNWDGVRTWIDRHRSPVLVGGVLGLTVIGALRIGLRLANSGFDPVGVAELEETATLGWLLDKQSLGPLRVVLIGLIGPAAYLSARHRLPLDRLLTAAGARSLRVYVVSTVAMMLWPVVTGTRPWPVTEVALVVATALVLSTALLPAIGRGRPWSF